MSAGTQISQFEKAQDIPSGSTYIAEMGDGSGTKGITQEVLTKKVGEGLKIGNAEELQTKNKDSLVGAINEAAQTGGDGSSVDILDSKEEIEANTESGKVAGALAVKEMFGEISNHIGGCSFEQEGNDFFIIGADSVRKKLGDTLEADSANFSYYTCAAGKTDIVKLESGKYVYVIFQGAGGANRVEGSIYESSIPAGHIYFNQSRYGLADTAKSDEVYLHVSSSGANATLIFYKISD